MLLSPDSSIFLLWRQLVKDGLLEDNAHSFVVKIWPEGVDEKTGVVTWRGRITHVPGGERRYLKDLDDVTVFMASYLESMGVKLTARWRVRNCLKRLWACLGAHNRHKAAIEGKEVS
jgi:hypothetical protein